MKRLDLLLPLFVVLSTSLFGQFSIGHKTVVFNDPARANRAVQTEIYYPAQAAGDDQPIAAGAFPAIVFGHGFVMSVNAYSNVWEALVPAGYILCLPTTEGGFGPSHDNFAHDLAFLVTALQEAGNTSGGFWEAHFSGKFALMGHSMGGGSALLATPLNPAITATAVFAPAETNPSAIAACAQIQRPVLIFTGSQDCIVPTASHAGPMFAAVDWVCKIHVDLSGGNHCYFGDYNFNCNFGETTTGCQPGISREQQHALVMGLLLPWLDAELKADASQWTLFQNGLTTTAGITVEQDCALSSATNSPSANVEMQVFPNPADKTLTVTFSKSFPVDALQFSAVDSSGRMVALSAQKTIAGRGNWQLDVSALPAGAYRLVAFYKEGSISAGWIKN